MAAPAPARQRMDAGQRRIVAGTALPVLATYCVTASVNYLMDPLVEELGLAADSVATALQLPSLAAILVVFSAGALGDRLGRRRVMVGAGCAFVLGCLLVALAPGTALVSAGLLLCGASASAVSIVALATLSARIVDPGARASAFAVYAAVAPVAFLVMPLLAAGLVENVSWRLVPALWLALGAAGVVATWWLLPDEGRSEGAGDLVSPLLFGVALVSAVQCVTWADTLGPTQPATLLALAVAVVAATAGFVAYRRAQRPSLALSVAWRGAMPVLLVIIVLGQFANLWFYMLLAYRYAFELSVTQTALVMTPAQITGILGAFASRSLVARYGLRRAGTWLLLCLAGALLTTLTLTTGSPLWQPIVVMCLFGAASVAASIPLTNAIMNTAPARHSGTASALRGAASSVGAALGGALMGGLVLGGVQQVLVDEIVAVVESVQDPAELAQRLEVLGDAPNPASEDPLLVSHAEQVQEAFARAMLSGIRLDGLAGAGIAVVSAGMFWASQRGRRELPDPD